MSRPLLAVKAGVPGRPAPRASRARPPLRGSAWRRRLRAWYLRHRRALPWRVTRDPYRIWVSEVMLQQTRVATARPYYEAFVRRFPTVSTLARAREDDVLALWAGLGYYRRARHLLEAARRVARRHGGELPDDPAAFGSLPGVGRYTAGAVLSIAFDRRLPALDGNVARVLARLHALPASARDPGGARALWELAGSLVPARNPGDWNQALMELGATLCRPRAPLCGACPVARWCRARAIGRIDAFPPANGRRPPHRVRRAVALVVRGNRVLLARCPGPLLEGLWEPPGVELAPGAPAHRSLALELRRLGVRARLEPTGRTVRHAITHRRIEVEVWRGVATGRTPSGPGLRWEPLEGRPRLLTGLGRKLLQAVPRPRVSSSSR